MKQNPIQSIICNQPINTHSIIQLSQLEQVRDRNYSYQWLSQKHNNQSLRISDNYIFTRFDITKISKNSEYQCTPLDNGNIIIAKVLVENDGNHEVVKEYRYGPVAMEPQVANFMKDSDHTSAKMVINKNSLIQVSIHIGTPAQIMKPSDQKVYIIIEAEGFRFELCVDKSTRLPSSNSFFKFYDKEDNSLGISMYHQHSEFMEKLKGMKILSHFGFYIKLYFKDRLSRDAFLFKIIQSFETDSSNLKPRPQIQITITQSKFIKSEVEEPPAEEIVRKSSGQRNQEIDEQIYKLLYETDEKKDQLSLDMADAQFLLASSKKLDLNNSKILKELKDSHCSSLQKKSQYLTQKNANRPQSKKSYEFSCFKSQKIVNQTFAHKLIERIDEECIKNISITNYPKEGSQNYLRSTITKLTNQVQNLIKQNKKLAQENKKLRDENMRLRFKEIKNTSHKYLSRKISISKNASKDIFRSPNPNDVSISVSPLKSTIKYELPKMYRPSQTKCRSNIGKSTLRRQQRNYTTLINKVMPTQSTSFILISPAAAHFTPQTPTHSQFNNGSLKNVSNIQMMTDTVSKDFIKEDSHQNNNPFQLRFIQNAKSKEKVWLPKSNSTKRKSYDGVKSTKRIAPEISQKLQYDYGHTPSFSQIIPTQMVKARGFGTTSTHYTPLHHR